MMNPMRLRSDEYISQYSVVGLDIRVIYPEVSQCDHIKDPSVVKLAFSANSGIVLRVWSAITSTS